MTKLILPLLAVAVMLAGCGTDNKKNTETAHTHDEVSPEKHTLYSDQTELFVEFDPLVVNEPASFAAHFTILGDSFKPMTEGSVRAELIVMGKVVSATADAPASPGIFRLSLTPAASGRGALVFHITTPGYTDKITISEVDVYKNSHDAAHAKQQPANPNEIAFSKELAWRTEFASEQVKKAAFPQIIQTAGEIMAAPGDESALLSPAEGKIFYASEQIAPGAEVGAGQNIFIIAATGAGAENISRRYIESLSGYTAAKSAYERGGELVKEKIISLRDYENLRNEYESARAEYNSLAQNFDPGKGYVIKAEHAGTLTIVTAGNGQFTKPGDFLGAVSKNRQLRLMLKVSPSYFSLLNNISGVSFRVANGGQVYRSEDLNGKLVSYGKNTNAQTPMIPVIFEMNHPGNLATGLIAEAFLKIESRTPAIAIPLSAIIEEQGNFYVYTQTGGESFLKKEVTLGLGDGIMVPVLSGLDEGDRVVTKGAHYIKITSAVGSVPAHGHEH